MDGVPWAPDPSEAMDSMQDVNTMGDADPSHAMDSMQGVITLGDADPSHAMDSMQGVITLGDADATEALGGVKAMDSMQDVITMENADSSQSMGGSQTTISISQTGDALISMESQPLDGLAIQSMNSTISQNVHRSQIVQFPRNPKPMDSMDTVHQPKPMDSMETVRHLKPMDSMGTVHHPKFMDSMEVNSGSTGEINQLEVIYTRDEVALAMESVDQHSTTNDDQQEIQETTRTLIIETPEEESSINVKDVEMKANQYFVPCGEAFDLSLGPGDQPELHTEMAQADIKSPEETATNIMDEMLKNIFSGGDETNETCIEDAEVTTIMEEENNFVNVSQFVVNQSIPLKFDPISGEMVPDIETEPDEKILDNHVERGKIETPNLPSKDLLKDEQFVAKTKGRNVAKIKPSSQLRNIAKVKPFPACTPLQMMTILSSTATHSSAPRNASEGKCSCSKHIVLGYPPSDVVYWQVRTTPGIRKTIMDFDNEGVKFLYDDGCLKAFQTVLRSFNPEFQSEGKELEVSLCLSCVRWAEGEAKETKTSPNSNNFPDISFRCYFCPAKVSTVKQFRVHLETSHAKDSFKCECKDHKDIYLAYSRLDPNPVPFSTKFDKNDPEVRSAIRSLREKGLWNGKMPICSFCIHFANSQNTDCVCMKHNGGVEMAREVKLADFERMSRVGLVLGDYYEGVSICKQCLTMSKKGKEKESLDKGANTEDKKRKRARPPTPEVAKKAKKLSTETENVYKKKYLNSRRNSSVVEEPKKEEDNNGNVLMYDIYCDIPGCNARLRGYPSLIKHFKSKHPAGTSDETIKIDDKNLDDVSSHDEGEENLRDEDDEQYLTFVKDPSKKFKAMADLPLLYIKVEKLNVKSSDEFHPRIILGKRKSVEFKEGDSLVEVHTISPRRKYETRRMEKDNFEMLATVHLNSTPKPGIIKLGVPKNKDVQSPESLVYAKIDEQPASEFNSPRSQMIQQGLQQNNNVPKLISPEISTNKKFEEVSFSE